MAGVMMPALRVTATVASFWRAGLQFTREPRELDATVLTPAQIVQLLDETMLIVEATLDGESWTVVDRHAVELSWLRDLARRTAGMTVDAVRQAMADGTLGVADDVLDAMRAAASPETEYQVPGDPDATGEAQAGGASPSPGEAAREPGKGEVGTASASSVDLPGADAAAAVASEVPAGGEPGDPAKDPAGKGPTVADPVPAPVAAPASTARKRRGTAAD